MQLLRRRIWSALLLALRLGPPLACLSPISAQHYTFHSYGRDEGLTNLNPTCVLQDAEGFLWVGTQSGLFRYDGKRFRAYSREDGLTNTKIEALFQTPAGEFFVGTDGGLSRLRGNRFESVKMGSADPSVHSFSIAADREGRLLVGTAAGLAVGTRQPDGSWSFQVYRPDLKYVQGVHVDQKGIAWFWCEGRICTYQSGLVATWPQNLGVDPNRTSAITSDADGNIWARSHKRLFVLRTGSDRFVPEDEGLPVSSDYTQLLMDRKGVLLAPTDLGLARRVGGHWRVVGKSSGLSTDIVSCVYQDREGSIWLGHPGAGLVRWLGYGEWEAWTASEGLSNENIWSIVRVLPHTIWVGTDTGVFALDDGAESPQWKRLSWLPKLRIDTLRLALDGGVWLGSTSGGLIRADPRTGKSVSFGVESGLLSTDIIDIALSGARRLWVSTRAGLLRGDFSDSGKLAFVPDGPPPNETGLNLRLLLDHAGRFWLGTKQGLFLREATSWRRFSTKDGLKESEVARLLETRDGAIWIGYQNDFGISRLRFDSGVASWRHFDKKSGLQSNVSSFLVSDSEDAVWVGSDNGVDVFGHGYWRHFGRADGLVWDDCNGNSAFVDADRSLWIGASLGLSHFIGPLPVTGRPPDANTSARIYSTTFGDRPVSLSNHISIPFSGRNFDVRYGALTFLNEAAVHFRYRLYGYDEEWRETAEGERRYPQLPPGHFRFEVQTIDAAGRLSSPATLAFEIEPPWWRSWWFVCLLLAACLAAGRILWQWRVAALLKRQSLLERAVEERTRQLEREQENVLDQMSRVEQRNGEIEILLREAQQGTRFKSQFIAHVSHELRTPLNSILGLADLLMEARLRPPDRENAQLIQSSANALLAIVNDILDVSKVEAGKMTLEAIDFSLHDLLDEVIKPLAVQARKKDLELSWETSEDVWDRLVGDPVRLRQVLTNLVGNSIKFTHQGSVRICVALESMADYDLVLKFSVVDTGIGIPTDQQEAIFEPYQQGGLSVARRYGGTGLGLSICRRLAELMGGRMWVESEPGLGSRFFFTARLQRQRTAATYIGDADRATVQLPKMSNPGRGRTVLLAEDNIVNQRLLSILLERQGWTVVTANDGRQAWELSQSRRFDLILMDVHMPEASGLEVTESIRQREGTGPRTPILALTAGALPEDRESCLKAGMDGYITKPVSAKLLYEQIDAVLPGPISKAHAESA